MCTLVSGVCVAALGIIGAIGVGLAAIPVSYGIGFIVFGALGLLLALFATYLLIRIAKES